MEKINTPDSGRKVADHHTRNSPGHGLKTSSHPAKALIIGLGQLGLPVAKYVLERGFDTYGYDISVKAMERAEKTSGIKRALGFDTEDFDVFIISISTHQSDDMFSPQIEGLLSIAHNISKEAKKDGALVSIESTIPKGTSKRTDARSATSSCSIRSVSDHSKICLFTLRPFSYDSIAVKTEFSDSLAMSIIIFRI